MDVTLEIALFAIMQIGAQVWLNATLKANLKNLTGWVEKIDSRSTETAELAAELKGWRDSIKLSRTAR